MRVGVLALQGDFREHMGTLRRLNVEPVEVRLPQDLEELDGLIIPGGESTTITRLLDHSGLKAPLEEHISQGFPVMGTCAGMIVLAKEVVGLDQPTLHAMHITVERNAFGRQVASFETDLIIPQLGSELFHAVFIRAPRILEVHPPAAIVATLEDGTTVAALEGNLLALAFHPELTDDSRFHHYFLDLIDGATPSVVGSGHMGA